jgi:hypothetical protein
MSCKKIRDSLSPYLEGLVSAEEKRAIREHLDRCSQCRAALEDLEKTQALLNSMEEVEPPPWMAAKIMARVRDEAEKASLKGWRKFFYPFHIKIPLQAFATILVVVLAVQLYKTMEPRFDPTSGRMAAKAPVVSEDARQGVQESAPMLPQDKTPAAGERPRSKAKSAEPGRNAFPAGGGDLDKQEMPKPAAEIPAAAEAGNDTALKTAPAPAPSARMKAVPPSAPAAVMPEYPYAAAAQSRAKAKADMEMSAEQSYRAEKKAMSRDFALKSMGTTAPVEIALQTADAANAAREIEEFLKKIGAANVSRKAEDGRQIITAETNREGAAALVKKLNELGKASTGPAQWPTDRFNIKIEIRAE